MMYVHRRKPGVRVGAIRFTSPESIYQIREAFLADVEVIRPDLIKVDGELLASGDYAVGNGIVCLPKPAAWFERYFKHEEEQLELF